MGKVKIEFGEAASGGEVGIYGTMAVGDTTIVLDGKLKRLIMTGSNDNASSVAFTYKYDKDVEASKFLRLQGGSTVTKPSSISFPNSETYGIRNISYDSSTNKTTVTFSYSFTLNLGFYCAIMES